MAENQWLNQATNISINYIDSTAYIHVPAQRLYNIYLNPNQKLHTEVHFNAEEWPFKFDKIQNWGIDPSSEYGNNYCFFMGGGNNTGNIGNGLMLSQNQLITLCALNGAHNAYGDIYFNVDFPNEYTRAEILGRHDVINNSLYAPALITSMLYSSRYTTYGMTLDSQRIGWLNFHIHDGILNNYLYNYFASYRDNDSASPASAVFTKVNWTTMTNGYYNNTYKIRVYYNNPHHIAFNNLTNIAHAFSGGDRFGYRYINVNGLQPICSDNVVNMAYAYHSWKTSNGHPVCGENVVNMSYSYYKGHNFTGSPVVGNKVQDMSWAYYYCANLTGRPIIGKNVINIEYAYGNCYNLTGPIPSMPNTITSMRGLYSNCHNLTGAPICGNNIIFMDYAYTGCNNLTGAPVCGSNVESMSFTYCGCSRLTGSPVCGDKVKNLAYTYDGCGGLSGTAVVGNNVINMYFAYAGCRLTPPSKIYNTSEMGYAFYNCRSLTTLNISLYNVRRAQGTFESCTGVKNGDVGLLYFDRYFYDPFINNNYIYAHSMFNNINNRINVYVVCNREWDRYLYGYPNNYQFKQQKVVWTNMENGYYNTAINVYVYNNMPNNPGNSMPSYYGFNVMNLIDASSIYSGKTRIIGTPVCGDIITNLNHTYYCCSNLTGNPVCGNNVINMEYAYYSCNNLTGGAAVGENVINMSYAYYNCLKLNGNPVSGNNVVNMSYAYCNCINLTGQPMCGPNVVNAKGAYYRCSNLTGIPVIENNLEDMSYMYYGCSGLMGQPVFPSNIKNVDYAYYGCNNLTGTPIIPKGILPNYLYYGCNALTGSPETIFGGGDYDNLTTLNYTLGACKGLTGNPWCGPNIINFIGVYSYCSNLTGNFVCGDNVKNFGYTYVGCVNLSGNIVCGPNVEVFSSTYTGCTQLIGDPICGPNVKTFSYTYSGCTGLNGSPVCGSKVENFSGTYTNCINLTGNFICGSNVKEFSYTYNNCIKLTGNPVCGGNVINFVGTYTNCINLKGNPVCGSNVTNMSYTYQNCIGLTGNPVCGTKVSSMIGTYINCVNLRGNPICGSNVISMNYAYQGCVNLTGKPVCGSKVNYMVNAYTNCVNLEGNPVFISTVDNIANAYYNCQKLTGTAYWNHSNYRNITATANNIQGVFGGRTTKSPRINLYVSNRNLFNNLYNINNQKSLLGIYGYSSLWTNYSVNFFYNTNYNLYVYSGSSYPTNSYTVAINGTGTGCLLNGVSSYSGSSTTTTSTYTISLTADGVNWIVPNNIEASSLITILGSEYSYTFTNNTKATISLKNMAPKVLITAKGKIKNYSVTITGNHLLINNVSTYTTSIPTGGSEVVTLTASGDYKLPSSISLSNLIEYNRIDDNTGTITILPSGTSQSLSRTINAAIKRANLTYNPTNCISSLDNPNECTDINYQSLQLYFTFDGTDYICPNDNDFSRISVSGATYTWHKQDDLTGYLTLSSLQSNNIVISVYGRSTSIYNVTVNAMCDYGWYPLYIYDCVDGSTPGNYLTDIYSGPTTFELSTPYLYLSAETISCQDVTGGISQYNGSNIVYSVSGDGSVTVSYTTQCFVKGTKITMADGSQKLVEDIEYGDRVKIWDFDSGNFSSAPVIWLTKKGLKNDHYYKLTFSDGTILCTTGKNSNHKIYNVDERFFKGVDKTEIGDRIFSENGIVTVIDKEYIKEQVEYYNLITSEQFNCFANGILTSDRYGNMYPVNEEMIFIKDDRPFRPLEEFTSVGIQEYWFKHLKLYESADSLDSILSYIIKCESQMRKLPEGFDPTWTK